MIARIARLLVCGSCGLHATIEFADGSSSERLNSEEEIFACVRKAVQEGKLHLVEADYLNEAARKSTLLEVSPTVLITQVLGVPEQGDDLLSSKPQTLH